MFKLSNLLVVAWTKLSTHTMSFIVLNSLLSAGLPTTVSWYVDTRAPDKTRSTICSSRRHQEHRYCTVLVDWVGESRSASLSSVQGIQTS